RPGVRSLLAGRRNRIARRPVITIHDALVGVLLAGRGDRIARRPVISIHDALVGVLLVAFRVWILGPAIRTLCEGVAACGRERCRDREHHDLPGHFELLVDCRPTVTVSRLCSAASASFCRLAGTGYGARIETTRACRGC